MGDTLKQFKSLVQVKASRNIRGIIIGYSFCKK